MSNEFPKEPDCDVIEKVALKPFPKWKPNWQRTDFAPNMSMWNDRKPSIPVSSGYLTEHK